MTIEFELMFFLDATRQDHLTDAREINSGLEIHILSRKDRGKCALQGFKLRYTGLSIDRTPPKIDCPRSGPQF